MAGAAPASSGTQGTPNLQIIVTALQSQVQAISNLASTMATAFQNITDPSGTN
jgi:hypothetical protein